MKTANCYRVCWLVLLCGMASDSLAQARATLPDVLTLHEAVELLRTDQETVRLMAEAWTIPGQRISGDSQHAQWRFSREALMAWLEKRAARSASLLAPEFTETTRQFETAEQGALRASEQQSQGGGRSLDGGVGSRPRGHSAAEMFLRDQSVLLSENEISVDVGVFYVRRDSQVIANLGAPSLATVESRSGVLQTVLRYSFRDSTEVFVRASGDSRTDKVYLSGSQLGDTSSSAG